MNLETERLIIRDFVPEDLQALHEIFGDDVVMENVEPAYTLAKTEEFLRTFCIGRRGAVAAVLKSSKKLIGYILFKELEPEVYEIGWIFHKDFWRQGYAYESCREVVRYAFDELGAHKLMAEAIDGIKSVGLMKKLGMQLEGIQKSHTRDNHGAWANFYLYGLLREQAKA